MKFIREDESVCLINELYDTFYEEFAAASSILHSFFSSCPHTLYYL